CRVSRDRQARARPADHGGEASLRGGPNGQIRHLSRGVPERLPQPQAMSCSSDTSAYTTELDRIGVTAGVPTSVTTASKIPETMRVMGSSSQSVDDLRLFSP